MFFRKKVEEADINQTQQKNNLDKFSEEAWERINLEIQKARIREYAKKAANAKSVRAYKKAVIKLHTAIKREIYYEEQYCNYLNRDGEIVANEN